MPAPATTVAILGASGLIGEAVAASLIGEGFRVVAVARRFTTAQATALEGSTVTAPVADLSVSQLAWLFAEGGIDVVVNCLGVLQDGPRGSSADIHERFVEHLVEAIQRLPRPVLLIHLSVPGQQAEDTTAFSRTKRAGERAITGSGLPFVLLRPGFVVAPTAYGGSALVRALAAWPFELPDEVGARPFAVAAIGDVARTVGIAARRWGEGERSWSAVWDICEREPSSVAAVVAGFRHRFGHPAPGEHFLPEWSSGWPSKRLPKWPSGWAPPRWLPGRRKAGADETVQAAPVPAEPGPARVRLPAWLLRAGAWAGDAAGRLGWSPPVRSTALREMMRGVRGQPEAWIAATGIEPERLDRVLASLPSTIQERWFARLFLLKPVVLASLALFWIVSGLIALTVSFAPAAAILSAHGIPPALAGLLTALTSLADIAVGVGIALRRTSREGLLAGIGVSLLYMAGALVLAPGLWIDPLGPLVKTGAIVVLMMVALAILDER